MNFPTVTEEGMAAEVNDGYVWLDYSSVPQVRISPYLPISPHISPYLHVVWLDYSSVPQAKEAEEARLRAIDSIPFYVDHASAFIALVPRVEHKDLPGVFCDYKSWQSRGWCRLETQVHELRLALTLTPT